ncbi:hypothetical protein R1flu_002012 [Riccia fluitans]|uniref:Uncharacterized protein n=1 Tax=Riccia fluitans TaxID=41844 RepID=A0ABD1Y4X3_9MARC
MQLPFQKPPAAPRKRDVVAATYGCLRFLAELMAMVGEYVYGHTVSTILGVVMSFKHNSDELWSEKLQQVGERDGLHQEESNLKLLLRFLCGKGRALYTG